MKVLIQKIENRYLNDKLNLFYFVKIIFLLLKSNEIKEILVFIKRIFKSLIKIK